MSREPIFKTSAEEFSADAFAGAESLNAHLRGSADLSAAEAVTAFLRQLHVRALEMSVAEVVIDVKALEFMSSSCLRGFVGWLTELGGLAADQQYLVRFLSDPSKHWQRRSLEALCALAAGQVRIEP